jgi:hypothetical protein
VAHAGAASGDLLVGVPRERSASDPGRRLVQRGAILLAAIALTPRGHRTWDTLRGPPLEPGHTHIPRELKLIAPTARWMASKVAAAVAAGGRPESPTLLLATFSAFAFPWAVPGFGRPGAYHALVAERRVGRPIAVLRSDHDRALHSSTA